MPVCITKYTSIDDLIEIIARHTEASRNTIQGKYHIKYFKEYLNNVRQGPITLVVETEYVDRDYLEDYVAYYSRCFYPYKHFCARIHFFNIDFDENDFIDLITNKRHKAITKRELIKEYLGFVVIKPLPNAIIGRTRLSVYDSDGGRRVFPVIVDDSICLCGLQLSVESLAYQEQDTVAAACATSALWSSFHSTGMLFQHEIPTPIEITRRATERTPIHGRSLPSHGLSLPQMAAAVKSVSVSLEPYTVNLKASDKSDSIILKAHVYAYSTLGIPCILNVELIDFSDPQNPYCMGLHAVAVTGYSIVNKDEDMDYDVNLKAARINELYVHDDQIGPFARITFGGKYNGLPYIDLEGEEATLTYSLSSSWPGKSRNPGDVRFKPVSLLIPLYHKIRIPYERIQTPVSLLDQAIKLLVNLLLVNNVKIEWDVFLSFGKNLKEDVIKDRLNTKVKKTFLTMNIPHFVWRVKAYESERELFELIFDATDIERGNNNFMSTIDYRPSFVNKLKKEIENNLTILESFFEDCSFLREFIKKTSK